MSNPLVTIGSTRLFTAALASVYDACVMDTMDVMCISALIDVSASKMLMGSLQINHDIEGRSTANLNVLDLGAALVFQRGQPISITDVDNIKEFAGFVANADTTSIPGSTSNYIHSIEAGDYWYILQRRIAVYTAESITAGDAVRALWSEYLEEEGITIGLIEDGETLTEVAINYRTLAEALQKLASACDSFVVYIDYDKRLYFHRRSLYAAAWSITDGTDVLVETPKVSRSNENYRNREIIIGGTEETDLQVETFIGDGNIKSWALGYQVSRIASITVQVGGAGDPVLKTWGTKGASSTYDFYYAVGSETLTADIAPGAGDVVEIQYYGLFSIITQLEDGAAIATNVTLEGGGTGIVEHITTDDSLKSLDAATEYGNAKLAEYARAGISLSYETLRGTVDGDELIAGTIQHVAFMGLDDDFLITNVTKMFMEAGLIKWSIEAVNGAMHEAWDAFFGKGLTPGGSIKEGVNDVGTVTKIQTFSHTFYNVDRPNPYILSYPAADVYPGTDTWPCFEPTERFEYIVFYRAGVEVFRKAHTQVLDEQTDISTLITLIGPSEANYMLSHVGFWGGDSCSVVAGSGVELYKAVWSHLKTVLESLQINCTMTNGDA